MRGINEDTEPRVDDEGNPVYLTCDSCGKKDQSVEDTIDPFVWEIYDEEVPATLCDLCYQERCDDI